MKNKEKIINNIKVYESNLMIELSQSEREKLISEVIKIVDDFQEYDAIDLTNIEPTHFSIPLNHELRKDEIEQTQSQSIIKTSSNYKDGFIGIKNEK